MGVKGLMEGIILQSIEDLWTEHHRSDCVAFFRGRDFRICADAAGMGIDEQVEILRMVKSVLDRQKASDASKTVARRSEHRQKSQRLAATCR